MPPAVSPSASGEVGQSRACTELKYEKQIESHFSPAETGKE